MLSPRGKTQREKNDEQKQVIHFRLSESLYQKLRKVSDKRHQTIAYIMEEALKVYLDKPGGDEN